MNVVSWNLFGGGAEHTKWPALAEYLDRNCVAIAALMEVKLLASELSVISGHFQHHNAHAQLPPPGAARSNGMLLLVHKALQEKVKVMECCEEKGDDKHWMQIMIRMRSSAPAPSAHSIHLVVVHGTPHRDKEVRLQMWSKFLCSVHRRRDDRAALLIMGDLNAALEDEGRQKACPVVREVLAELELTDLWRLRHPRSSTHRHSTDRTPRRRRPGRPSYGNSKARLITPAPASMPISSCWNANTISSDPRSQSITCPSASHSPSLTASLRSAPHERHRRPRSHDSAPVRSWRTARSSAMRSVSTRRTPAQMTLPW
jgi:exonuclease III